MNDNFNGKISVSDNKSYTFSPRMKSFLDNEVQYFQQLENLESKKEDAKTAADVKEVDILKKEIKDKYRDRNTDKKRFLEQHIFRSMANLVIFFEHLEKYAELRNEYESYVKELFGFIGSENKKTYTKEKEIKDEKGSIKKVKEPYFTIYCKQNEGTDITRRLFKSLLTWDRDQDPNNFRLKLIENIQLIISEIISLIALEDFGQTGVHYIIDRQMIQARAWTALYGSRYEKSKQKELDSEEEPTRPIQF
jgi:hypothetical protein